MADPYPVVPEDDLSAGGWTLRSETAETLFRTPTTTVEGHTLVYEDAALAAALADAGVDPHPDGAGPLREGTDPPRDDDTGGILAGRVGESDAGGPWRFFFATRLSFSPPLAPGIGTATVIPTVLSEARRSFAADLRDRGFRDVERGRSERIRVRSGDRARLRKFTATLDVPRSADEGEGRPDGTTANGGADATAGRDDASRDQDEAVTSLSVEAWLAVWSSGGSFRVAGGAYPVSGLAALLPADATPETDPGTFRSQLLDLVRAVA